MQTETPDLELLSKTFIETVPRSMWAIRYGMREAADRELTVPQFRTLAQLWKKSRTNGELAESIGVSVPAMSRMVDGLVSAGYIERALPSDDARDRRRVQLLLTPRGRATFRRLHKHTQKALAERFAQLDEPSRRRLLDGLEVMRGLFASMIAIALLAAGIALGSHRALAEAAFNPEEHKAEGSLPAEHRSDKEVVAASRPDAQHALRIDLSTAIDGALNRNPTVRNFRERLGEAESLAGISLVTALPAISLTGQATYQKGALSTGNPPFGGEPYNAYQIAASLRQPIFSGFSTLAAYRVARFERELRTYDLEQSERDLSVQVIQAYYSVLLAQHKLLSLSRQREVQDDLLKLTKHRQVIGRSQLLDVLQIETERAQLLPQIDQARNSVRTSASQLALLLGERDATQFTLPDMLMPLDAAELLDPAKTPREPLPELLRAQGAREQFEETRTATLAPYYPSLDIVGSWGRHSYVKTDLLSQDATSWVLGLELTIPITAPLASIYQRRQLASQASQLEIQQAQVLDARSLSEVTTREGLRLAQSNLDAYRDAYRIAGKTLAEARRTYRLATIDYQQFLTTESAFFQAEISYEQSKYDVINAAAQYCVAAGVPLKQLYRILGVKKS